MGRGAGGEPAAARGALRAFDTHRERPWRAGLHRPRAGPTAKGARRRHRTPGAFGAPTRRVPVIQQVPRGRPLRAQRRRAPPRPLPRRPRINRASFLVFQEYVEKPLKLVLKVGGSEVTELSTGSSGHDSSLFEDKNDHDKHKDRKRKKRKKGEKQVPGEEKGRKRRRVKVNAVVRLVLNAGGTSPAPRLLLPIGLVPRAAETPVKAAPAASSTALVRGRSRAE